MHFENDYVLGFIISWWTFRIFFIFFAREGEGESEALGGGGISFLLKVPGGGGVLQDGRGGGTGRVSAAKLFFFWEGGGLNIFFGSEMSTRICEIFTVITLQDWVGWGNIYRNSGISTESEW